MVSHTMMIYINKRAHFINKLPINNRYRDRAIILNECKSNITFEILITTLRDQIKEANIEEYKNIEFVDLENGVNNIIKNRKDDDKNIYETMFI